MIYRWAHCKTELMETLIPEGVDFSSVVVTPAELGDDGAVISPEVTRQKTLREFIFQHVTHDLPDGTTVFLLACKQHEAWRMHGVNDSDLDDWHGFLEPYGHGRGTWITTEEKDALLRQHGMLEGI